MQDAKDLQILSDHPIEDPVRPEPGHDPSSDAPGTRGAKLPPAPEFRVLDQTLNVCLHRIEQPLGRGRRVSADEQVRLGKVLLRQPAPDDPRRPTGTAY